MQDYKIQLSKAIEECHFYNAIGALNDEVIEDIAFDNDVDLEELRKHIYG